jgi:hypothetical protein
MPDSPQFDGSTLGPDLSPKYVKLVEQIRALDAKDLRDHGTQFKHFIFTDIRESLFGAKAIASFLKQGGFDFRMGLRSKQIMRDGVLRDTKTGDTHLIEKPPVAGGSNGFAILQSLPLWKNPITDTTKRKILDTFNLRPDNVHGELLRIIVLDSRFKEGINLFDVKYVHLMEPAIASSDLQQAVGRATRFCGQKGLHFIPRRGWPLEIYTYTTILPKELPFHATNESNETINAHDLIMKTSGLDLSLLHITKEVTVLAIETAVDYALNYHINNFDLEEALLMETEFEEILSEVHFQKGGRPSLVAIHSMSDITPELLRSCSYRKSQLFPFSKDRMIQVARRVGLKPPKGAKRDWFCSRLQDTPDYLSSLLSPDSPTSVDSVPARTPRGASPFSDNLPVPDGPPPSPASIPSVRPPPPSPASIPSVRPPPPSPASIQSVRAPPPSPASIQSVRAPPPSPESPPGTPESEGSAEGLSGTPDRSIVENNNDMPYSFHTPEPIPHPESPNRNVNTIAALPFRDFQSRIRQMFYDFTWDVPVVRNKCHAVHAGKLGAPVQFSKTQEFVSAYLRPESPFKGMLAWHSVGTGKTCMGIAATAAFEAAGYRILWVTRNALMSEMYSNIFGSVCHKGIRDRIKRGLPIPADPAAQKRLLSGAMLPPMSYRTFQNALERKNQIGLELYRRNRDPLYKTFLVMDEIHKLQDGELGPAEAAEFKKIQPYIFNSYSKSGQESVRPLFMTATPITNTPKELFEILNTLIPSEERRLPEFARFRQRYANARGELSAEGKGLFQERAKGLISYLNREFDPTTFAQPKFHTIEVPVGDFKAPSAKTLAETCLSANTSVSSECASLEATYQAQKKALPATPGRRHRLAALTRTYKAKKKACETSRTPEHCYNVSKKQFVEKTLKSQKHGLKACLGPVPPPAFPSEEEFKTEIAKVRR